ncbi:uncharacterized protein LOC107424354 [Ziziphus jujuba]|uniref:Uncharacterized protein LOC107424354 n=3 Tax=Ziziphus jujuba TaxID=326968 RepID=A0A6P4AU53_ZIZJJ|nr:uncharacterized protein LOC107424354 [Ziziphus jujuba]XP_015889627.3 uncharacterized protein LOC107424354 [Ziziphus jujuba]
MGVEIMNVEAEFHEMEEAVLSDKDVDFHVRDILKSVSLGDCDMYNQLVAVMHRKKRVAPDEVALLVASLKSLDEAVSCIDDQHGSLLASILGMNLWNHGSDVMDALLDLIVNLATTSGKYVDLCLEMLVGNFTPPSSFINILNHPRGITKKEQVLSRVHSTLGRITNLVPLATLRLSTLVIQKKPSHFSKEFILAMYVENMLRLESGDLGEYVRSAMLSSVVDLLIDLDLEIGWDDILHDDSSKGIFKMELEDIDETTDDELKGDIELPRELSRKSLGRNEHAEKLDSLMVLTFEYLESCEAGGRLTKVFEVLLQSFQKTILPAYKSKFAQFVIFYSCALDPDNCGFRFANMLADIFFCNVRPQFERMMAVAYLASYLSRGRFLSTSVVVDMLKRLVGWCLDYCRMQEGEGRPNAHNVFYSGCQAIMYVLCFRMRSFVDVLQLKSQLFVILTHQLSPLKVCLPTVVMEFLRQAKAASLFTISENFDFDDYLESELSRAFGGMERLDMFFPFDPCLLKRSDRYLRPHFVYWSMVRPTYDDDDEEGSGDDDEDMAKSFQEFDLDEFDGALNKMSITPKMSTRMPSRIRPSTSPESL